MLMICELAKTEMNRDLVVVINSSMKVSAQCAAIFKKANSINGVY